MHHPYNLAVSLGYAMSDDPIVARRAHAEGPSGNSYCHHAAMIADVFDLDALKRLLMRKQHFSLWMASLNNGTGTGTAIGGAGAGAGDVQQPADSIGVAVQA